MIDDSQGGLSSMTQAVFRFRHTSHGRLLRPLHCLALPNSLWIVKRRFLYGLSGGDCDIVKDVPTGRAYASKGTASCHAAISIGHSASTDMVSMVRKSDERSVEEKR